MERFRNIKKEIEEFFRKTKLNLSVEVANPKEETIPVRIKAEEPKTLIGQQGQILNDIQRLLKIFLKKKFPEEKLFINLDVNSYKEKKAEYLREMARSVADDAVLTGQEKRLGSMPASERRIIHMELAERDDVETESLGKEPERGVVIKPR